MLVCDASWRVLLFEVLDHDGRPPLWITPGGGLEVGEDRASAAARELAEETGLTLEPVALGEPVAVTAGEWTYRGERFYSVDWFFVVEHDGLVLDVDGWTDLEREVVRRWRWWSSEELSATDARVVPGGLAALLERLASGWRPEDGPLELAWRRLS